MTECAKFQELCSAFLDDELTAEEQAALHAHLAVCPDCAAYLDALRQIAGVCHEGVPDPPVNLHENIMDLVLAEAQSTVVRHEKRRPMPPVFTMIATAAVVVLLVLSGVTGDLLNFGDRADLMMTSDTAAGASAPDGNAPEQAMAGSARSVPVPAATQIAPYAEESPQPAASAALDTQDSVVSAETVLPTIPESIANTTYAFCYLSTGSAEVPSFEGTLAAQSEDGTVSYFTVRNNMGVLEKALGALADGGYESEARQDVVGITLDTGTQDGLIIVLQRTR